MPTQLCKTVDYDNFSNKIKHLDTGKQNKTEKRTAYTDT